MRLYRVIYHSLSSISAVPARLADELVNILDTAQARNAAEGVTGALVYNKGMFIQVLEGPQVAVQSILHGIIGDSRHCDVRLLQPTLVSERRFGQWSMGLVETSATRELFDANVGLMTRAPNQLRLDDLLDVLVGSLREGV